MLRTLGIPSVLVAGFNQGEYDEDEDVYIVRNSDAHAWVEAFIDGAGWVRFDPTPPAVFELSAAAGVLEKISDFIGIMRYRWQRYFLSYSLRDQFDILRHTGNQVSNLNMQRISYYVRAHLGDAALLMLLLTLGGALAWRMLLRGKAGTADGRIKPGRQAQNAMRQYTEIVALLSSRLAVNRRTSQTALEFAYEVGRLYPQLRETLMEFSRIYLELRFGSNADAPQKRHELSEKAREIRTIIGKPADRSGNGRLTGRTDK